MTDWNTGKPEVDGTYLVTVVNPYSGYKTVDTLMFAHGEWMIDMYQVIGWQELPEEYNG